MDDRVELIFIVYIHCQSLVRETEPMPVVNLIQGTSYKWFGSETGDKEATQKLVTGGSFYNPYPGESEEVVLTETMSWDRSVGTETTGERTALWELR